ncbi:MAG: cytidylyltransferase domain-containing protein [Wenzhouxiangella sp.]
MPEPRLGIIIFARMSSSRLPGKMLRPLGPTTLFDRIVERARLLEQELILATSDQTSDDALVQRAGEVDLPVFRGSLRDVLERAVGAARHAGFDAFCRLCGDRPFMPLDDMARGIEIMRDSFTRGNPLDLVTTQLPTPVPKGLCTEIVRTAALAGLGEDSTTAAEREHVTAGFYSAPDKYRIHALETAHREYSALNFSVDEARDLELISQAIEAHPDPGLPVVVAAQWLARKQLLTDGVAAERHGSKACRVPGETR